MLPQKKIFLLTSGQPALNPRLVKEADALADNGYDVTVLYAYWNKWGAEIDEKLLPAKKWRAIRIAGHPVYERFTYFVSRLIHKTSLWFTQKLNLKFFNDWAIARSSYFLIREARKHQADLYIGHNLGALPAIIKAAKYHQKPCGFDAEDFHRYEITDDESDSGVILKSAIENKYLPLVNYLSAASPGIGEAYKGLYPGKSPVTILNVFPVDKRVAEPKPAGTTDIQLFWFSQTISAARGVNDCIDALRIINNPGIGLHLLGYADGETKRRLTDYAGNDVNLIFHVPVGPDEIALSASRFDVGLAMEPTEPYNRDICLANKIFTYMQAGLAIIASNTTAQTDLLTNYPGPARIYENGNTESLALAITHFLNNPDDLYAAKKVSFNIARNELNWETESRKFLQLVKKTLSA